MYLSKSMKSILSILSQMGIKMIKDGLNTTVGEVVASLDAELLSEPRKQALMKRVGLIVRATDITDRLLNEKEAALRSRIRAVKVKAKTMER